MIHRRAFTVSHSTCTLWSVASPREPDDIFISTSQYSSTKDFLTLPFSPPIEYLSQCSCVYTCLCSYWPLAKNSLHFQMRLILAALALLCCASADFEESLARNFMLPLAAAAYSDAPQQCLDKTIHGAKVHVF